MRGFWAVRLGEVLMIVALLACLTSTALRWIGREFDWLAIWLIRRSDTLEG